MSCNTNRDKTLSEWTILVYMGADNNLTPSARKDINEMESAILPDNVNVIVQADYIDSVEKGTFRYLISHDNDENFISSPVLARLKEMNSASPEVLSDFIKWSYKNFPSKKRALIIWSHGTGWRSDESRSIILDGYDKISIANGDFKRAMDDAGYSLDLIAFDACNMHSFEILSEIEKKTDYVVASQMVFPSKGFPYDDIFNEWDLYSDTNEITQNIADNIYQSYQPGGSQNYNGSTYRYLISATDTKEFIKLKTLIMEFFEKYINDEGMREKIKLARNNCYGFNDSSAEIDINEFFVFLSDLIADDTITQEINVILSQIRKTFIYMQPSNYVATNVGTAVIWFPTNRQVIEAMEPIYGGLQFSASNWIEILKVLYP